MKKTAIIKEIVGEALKPYGFEYMKTEGSSRIFVKRLEGIKSYYDPEKKTVEQYIGIYESSYSKSLRVELDTDAYGHGAEELEELNNYAESDGIGFLVYSDEESYRKCLEDISDAIIKYGLSKLGEMSIEEEVIPTKAMGKRLYEEHKELEQAFVEKYEMSRILRTEEDVEECFDRIREILINTTEQPYEEVKELILMVSAYISERLCELPDVNWKYDEETQCFLISSRYFVTPIIAIIVRMWKNKCDNTYWSQMDFEKKVLKEFVK